MLLFLDGNDVDVQAFMVQIRSLEDHQPLPGILRTGEVSESSWDSTPAKVCFTRSREPRENMMVRYANVPLLRRHKLVYLTIVDVRANLVESFALTMVKVTAITMRFGAARIRGCTPASFRCCTTRTSSTRCGACPEEECWLCFQVDSTYRYVV